jgi:Pectate lyase superfamily protein
MLRLLRRKRDGEEPAGTTTTRRDVLAGAAVGVGAGVLWPSGAQALDPPDDRYVFRSRSVINVKDYGATGDGSTPDDTAIQSAIAALPSVGGTLFFPHGNYKCAASLNFDQKWSVVLAGEGGLSGGAVPASRIFYTGTGARFVSARSTQGFTIRDLAVSYTSGFSGTLVDLSALSGALDTQMARIENSLIGSGTPSLCTARLLDLEKTISSSFTNVSFSGGDVAVRGKSASTYSNAISFRSCMFVYQQTVHVKNAGQAWSFDGCTFEQLVPGTAGAYTHDSDVTSNSLSFHGCWFGDAGTGSAAGTWITFAGAALSVRSCYISTGNRGVLIEGFSNLGIDISANGFNVMGTGVEFTQINDSDVVILSNCFNAVTNPIVYGASLQNGIVQCDVNGARFNDVMKGMRMTGGAPSDAYWQSAPPNGTFYLDTVNHRLYVRDGGAWKWVALN